MLILLDEPNVLILDEPSNDLDTDMLAAMEDLLDTWPGTLLVVSHDRYLMERVTDQQYAVIDGSFRHLPGGVDEYLALSAAGTGGSAAGSAQARASPRRRLLLSRIPRRSPVPSCVRHRRSPVRLSVASPNSLQSRRSYPSR